MTLFFPIVKIFFFYKKKIYVNVKKLNVIKINKKKLGLKMNKNIDKPNTIIVSVLKFNNDLKKPKQKLRVSWLRSLLKNI